MLYQEVSPPSVAPIRTGLVSGGRRPPNPGRWQLGIAYDPLFDHLGNAFPTEECLDLDAPLDPGDLEKVVPDGEPVNKWAPYTVWIGEKCGPMAGRTAEEFDTRLREQMAAQTSRLVEQVFSSGVVALTDTESYTFDELGFPNRPLESTEATIISGVHGIVSGISALVEAMALEIGGARGMVHVPHFLLPYLDFYGQVVRNPGDGTFITLKSHDHIVIAGTGYRGFAPDGSDPGDATTWIYGTSPVEVRLEEEIEILPSTQIEAVNIRTNEQEYRAERLTLASWDLSAHVAVEVDLTDPGPATS